MARKGAGRAVAKRGKKKVPQKASEITKDVVDEVAAVGNTQSEGAVETAVDETKPDVEMTDSNVQENDSALPQASVEQDAINTASTIQHSIEQAAIVQGSIAYDSMEQNPAEQATASDAEFKVLTRESETPNIQVAVPTLAQGASTQSSPLSEVPSVSLPSRAASASENDFAESYRPSRKRRLPTRYAEDTDTTASSAINSPTKEANVADSAMLTEPAKPVKAIRASARTAAKEEVLWSEKSLFESPDSLLVNADLVKMLQDPELWDCLSDEDKLELLATFPEDALTGPSDNPKSRVREEFLKYNNDWKSGVRMFQEDLSAGRYDPEWLRQAQQALEAREHGDFDKFKEKEYEEFWGQKQKMAHDVVAGDSSKMKLETLIKNGVFQVGDIWQFCRAFGKGKGKKSAVVVVEKEATIIAIGTDNKLTFTYPPGQFKLSSPNLREDVQITGITGPGALETAIIKEDSRITSPPNGNAWKAIRCKRNNQDLGALWDMRQFFFIHSNTS